VSEENLENEIFLYHDGVS